MNTNHNNGNPLKRQKNTESKCIFPTNIQFLKQYNFHDVSPFGFDCEFKFSDSFLEKLVRKKEKKRKEKKKRKIRNSTII